MPNINGKVVVDTTKIIEGAGPITLDGINLGSFRDGITMSTSKTITYTKSDYALGEIDGEITAAEMSVNTILEQNTMTNMCIALGGNTSSSSSSSSSVRYDFGPEMSTTTSKLVFYGMSALDKSQGARYTFNRVVSVGQVSQTLKRGVEQLLPVSFKCLLDANGKWGTREEPIPLNLCV